VEEKRMRKWLLLPLGFVVALAQPAFAHPGHAGHDFVAGWEHPFFGFDHLLAMIAVGLLAVRMDGKAIWVIPCAFLGSMTLGGIAAAVGMPLPGVEYGILASVLVLGLLIAATKVVPLGYGAALVALFAFFHGHAHAAEMATGSSLATYAAGFLLATALLHAAGVAGGLLLKNSRVLSPASDSATPNSTTLRWAGGLISLAGVLMCFGLV
jgi:urease accessory protein